MKSPCLVALLVFLAVSAPACSLLASLAPAVPSVVAALGRWERAAIAEGASQESTALACACDRAERTGPGDAYARILALLVASMGDELAARVQAHAAAIAADGGAS